MNNTSALAWFRNAAPYIDAHRGRTFVLAFEGEAVEDADFAERVHDIALLHTLGVRVVLVHGARPQIETRLKSRGLEMQYANGLRVTDDEALAAVKEAAGCLRVEIEGKLSLSLINTPMSGVRIRVASGNFIIARPLGVRDGVDFKHTGEVRKVDTQSIRQQLDLGNIVLLSPIGYSPTGEVFNLSAEDVATATACSLQADKLIFLSEARDKRALPKQLSLEAAQKLLTGRRTLSGQSRAHLESAITASLNGVRRIHLIARKQPDALLTELYTRDGAGTLITAEEYENVRSARTDDISGILELIAPLEEKGLVVRRSREQLELEINRFVVIERDGMIIACAALYPFPDEHLGELACLAVHPDYRKGGRGERLINEIERHAREMSLQEIFVLTTQALHWFRERGFQARGIDKLPVKKRELYNYQRNSKVFFKTL
ncbi:MAG: amino-acid N-acetyltransferase [Gammaproteobacteria bacterium]